MKFISSLEAGVQSPKLKYTIDQRKTKVLEAYHKRERPHITSLKAEGSNYFRRSGYNLIIMLLALIAIQLALH